MSEQDAASVGRYLDRLEAQRGDEADEARDRRVRAAVPRWGYLTWATADTKAGRAIRLMNGERPDEYPLEYPALVEAGEQGGELVAAVAAGVKQEHVLHFNRPLAED